MLIENYLILFVISCAIIWWVIHLIDPKKILYIIAKWFFASIASISFIFFVYYDQTDVVTKEREAVWQAKDAEVAKNTPPKLITKVGDCEIWQFYMQGSNNHYLAKCPNATSSVTYPISKNSTQTISTETK